ATFGAGVATITSGEGDATSFSHLQSSARASSRRPRKTGLRRLRSRVHPVKRTRATKTGEVQDAFSFVFGAVLKGHVDVTCFFNLRATSSRVFRSKPVPT